MNEGGRGEEERRDGKVEGREGEEKDRWEREGIEEEGRV